MMRLANKSNALRRQLRRNGTAVLAAGTLAPDFALKSTPDQIVRLSEFRGCPAVLLFYPADWSLACGDQVRLYNEMLSEFRELDAEILGISVEGI
jgi:peroxiredoxin